MQHTAASGDLIVNCANHTPGMVVPWHEHANAYLCVVVAGSFEFQTRKSYDCRPGTVISHPSGLLHANRFSDRAGHCINIHVGNDWMLDRTARQWVDDFHHVVLAPGMPSLGRLSRELQHADNVAPLATVSAALELMADAMRAEQPKAAPKWLARVIDLIEADLAAAPALSELAALIGAHPSHLARLFKATHGETIGEYIRRRRVETADQAVRYTNRPIANIAADIGFADQAHFTRCYKHRFGVGPATRRRLMQAAF